MSGFFVLEILPLLSRWNPFLSICRNWSFRAVLQWIGTFVPLKIQNPTGDQSIICKYKKRNQLKHDVNQNFVVLLSYFSMNGNYFIFFINGFTSARFFKQMCMYISCKLFCNWEMYDLSVIYVYNLMCPVMIHWFFSCIKTSLKYMGKTVGDFKHCQKVPIASKRCRNKNCNMIFQSQYYGMQVLSWGLKKGLLNHLIKANQRTVNGFSWY